MTHNIPYTALETVYYPRPWEKAWNSFCQINCRLKSLHKNEFILNDFKFSSNCR